jgi:hypothetical protein
LPTTKQRPLVGALSLRPTTDLFNHLNPDGVLAAPAPKGTLTHGAANLIEKAALALGGSEKGAAQLARRFEDFNYDWNPFAAADEVGTQAARKATGSHDFDKAALTSGALNLALGELPVAGKLAGKALKSTKAGKQAHRWLTDPGIAIEKPLAGAPTRLGGKYMGPSPALRDTAREYHKGAALSSEMLDTYRKVDPERSKAIAKAYEAMKHDPANPDVQKAYRALPEETLAQYDALKKQGYEFDFYPADGSDPYPSPWDAVRDLRDNRRMKVYPTNSGYGSGAEGITPEQIAENPMLASIPGETWSGRPVLVNDAFRAVHDAFGHAKDGVGFRADGEETAWASHMPMFSKDAQRALTTETRGQNSWLNYGPNGEANRTAKTADTTFADQKIGLLPEWTLNPDGMPPRADWSLEKVRQLEASLEGNRNAFVAHMSPREFLGLTASEEGRKALDTTASLGTFDQALYDESGPINLGVAFGGEPSAYQREQLGVSQLPSMVMSHDGRHRMAALQQAGVDKVPVLIRAMNKTAPRALSNIELSPQRSRLSPFNNGDSKAIIGALSQLGDYKP